MQKFIYTIENEAGLHVRPAGLLVKQAMLFKCDIKIKNEVDGREADLKRLIAVLSLGIKKGDKVVISASGEDEAEAAAAIEKLLKAPSC